MNNGDFAAQLNSVLAQNNDNNNNNSNFRPSRIGAKTPFLGRVLPLGGNQFPFVMYSVAWISYTKQDGTVSPLQVILDPNNREDKLAHLLNRAIEYNNQHRNGNSGPDTIKLASGKYPLRISRRATFLGVKVGEQNGQWGQAMDNQGRPVIEAFDVSFSGMQAIAELLKPDVPYMYNGQPMFNTPAQFITVDQTYPVSLKFVSNPGGGVGNWTASVQQVLLPQINFNYLEKNSDGTYKYIDDIVTERQPLMVSNPQFYERVFESVSQAYQQQMNGTQSNPYTVGNDDLPFSDTPATSGKTDVVAGMTGTNMADFANQSQNNPTPQATQPAPTNQPQQTPQGNVQATQPTTPNATQNGSQAPASDNNGNNTGNAMDNAFDAQSVDDFLNSINKQ